MRALPVRPITDDLSDNFLFPVAAMATLVRRPNASRFSSAEAATPSASPPQSQKNAAPILDATIAISK